MLVLHKDNVVKEDFEITQKNRGRRVGINGK